MRSRSRFAAAAAAALFARGYLAALRSAPPGGDARWRQANYAGRSVTRLAGPAHALAILTALPLTRDSRRVRAAVAISVGSAAAVGVYDDLVGDTSARGLAGHGSRLMSGHVTNGTLKVAGLATSGLVSGALLRRNSVDALVGGGVVAGMANLVNLLDLRPGRAIKSALVPGALALTGPAAGSVAAGLGAAVAVLPDDLGERVMLGDSGAGALGAVVGVGLAARAPTRWLRRIFVVIAALNVASEFVSFSKVIDRVPWLRVIDSVGRRP